jgi:hypothetical protein
VYMLIYYPYLLFCLFLGLDSWDICLAGRVIYILCGGPLSGVSGRYNLFECWPGVGGGAVRVFLLLGFVEVGTVRLK